VVSGPRATRRRRLIPAELHRAACYLRTFRTPSAAPAARDIAAYWLALVLAVLATALVYGLLRSRRGLALTAIRDNQSAASSLGVDPFRLKLMVYILCAFGAGTVGANIYLRRRAFHPTPPSLSQTGRRMFC
jgi:ABC-type branched-subunit amino acid transport system permease subunit